MEGSAPPSLESARAASIIWDYENSKIAEEFVLLLRNAGLHDAEIKEMTELVADILKEQGNELQAIDVLRNAVRQFPQLKELTDKVQRVYLYRIYSDRLRLLIENKIITTQMLEKAIQSCITTKKSVEYILISEAKVSAREIGKALASYYKVPFMGFDSTIVPPQGLINTLKKTFLLNEGWVPIKQEGETIHILVDNPSDHAKINNIKRILKKNKISIYVGIKEDIQSYIKLFYDGQIVPFNLMEAEADLTMDPLRNESLAEEEHGDMDEQSSEVVRFVDQMLINAYNQRASDIHIEPSLITGSLTIRFRIDGVLREIASIPLRFARPVLSRLKIMAKLDISEKRLPQDGKIQFRKKGMEPFEIRLATIPTAGGLEDAVLRILAKAGVMKLEDMGLEEETLRSLRKVISQPYGLILVVGPTGSGKTTTLHAVLAELNKPGVKIWTAEDPIEITQKGLRQVEVKPKIGLDFARVMRAFLRADPDIIMIGEMRDYETASTAVEASLTGHLVLSTLHTNSAPETITRLLDLGLNPINFSDSVLGILAQRLLRKLCPHCKEPYRPDAKEYEELLEDLQDLRPRFRFPDHRELVLYRPKGCHSCNNIGYKGRVGIYELLVCTQDIKSLIKKGASTKEILTTAKMEGMITLRQDGLIKILKGITDISELRRVVVE